MWKSPGGLWKTVRAQRREAIMKSNMRIYWNCPYYRFDFGQKVLCEGGHVSMPDAETQSEYVRAYCSSPDGWRRCTVARAVSRHYERAEDDG